MLLVVPAVVIFGAITFVLIKGFRLKFWHALMASLFGFFLAGTGLGPVVNELIKSLLELLHIEVR